MMETNRLMASLRLVASLMVALACACAIVAGTARADEAAADVAEAAPIRLGDGTYEVEVELSGGSGRATIESPTTLVKKGQNCTLTVTWSSPNYDYMIVDGTKYLPKNTSGNSSFSIPITTLAEPLAVVADTTAMSEPHEIDYEILVLESTLVRQEGETVPRVVLYGIAAGFGVILVAAIVRRNAAG